MESSNTRKDQVPLGQAGGWVKTRLHPVARGMAGWHQREPWVQSVFRIGVVSTPIGYTGFAISESGVVCVQIAGKSPGDSLERLAECLPPHISGLVSHLVTGSNPTEIGSHTPAFFTLAVEQGAATLAKLAGRPSFELNQVAEAISEYFAGLRYHFDDIRVDLTPFSTFTKSVLQECRRIEYGTAISYAELARRIGQPGAARAVGQALARNPVPLIIPCHRVIARNGQLRGFSAPGGISTKRLLLQMEGQFPSK